MLVVEFFADKIPGVDSVWDVDPHRDPRARRRRPRRERARRRRSRPGRLIAALMGGTLAATSHVAKATTRAAVNTSPEPFSNLGLSLLGDAAVPAMLYLAWEQPAWFFAALGVAVVAGLDRDLRVSSGSCARWCGGSSDRVSRATRCGA
jgi:hypothetical protein